MEIERKYLLKQLPSNLDSYASKKIAQGYLCTSPVVRVRRSNDSYYMTYKGAGLMVREEYNLPLTKEAYDHLVQKFEGDLAPLTLVEVEFDSVDAANEFTAPDWFGEDVTESGKYHNSYLSRLENS